MNAFGSTETRFWYVGCTIGLSAVLEGPEPSLTPFREVMSDEKVDKWIDGSRSDCFLVGRNRM